jgi:hypothetical protein
LRGALSAKRAAKAEESRVQYVAQGEEPQEASAARHAKLPAVFGAQVAR